MALAQVSYIDLLRHQLRVDEGVRNRPYWDSVGKLTIGVGRNLNDVGLNDDEIALMLDNDIDEAERTARRLLPSFHELSDVRKYVVCNMAFNLGHDRLKGFTKLLVAIHEENWQRAAKEMLDSKWARQVGVRAHRLALAMHHNRI